MPDLADILQILGGLALAILLIAVVRARHRGKAVHDDQYAGENVCEHLRPALDHLRAAGHRVVRVGQLTPEMPLEIHVQPAFDPAALYAQLHLEPPAHVSERNVLFCKDDWCELHPAK